jgi:hypothetical protein
MTPLLKLELRRQRPMVVKMMVLTVIVCGVFYLAGKRAPGQLLAGVTGAALGALLIVPMGISRDKMEGTLEFLCGLPVEPRAIASSRMGAMAVIAAPWAVAIGAMSFAVPAVPRLNPIAVTVLCWLAMLVIGACAVALMACFDLETLLGAPIVVLVISFVLVPRAARALFPGVTDESALRMLEQPAAPLVIAICLLTTGAVIGTVAFAAATRGFAGYRADPARR